MESIIKPREVYQKSIPDIPDGLIKEINQLLVAWRRQNPLEAIMVNLTDIEKLMAKYEGAVDPNFSPQDLLNAIILCYQDAWEINFKEGVFHFTPHFRSEGERPLRLTMQRGWNSAQKVGIVQNE